MDLIAIASDHGGFSLKVDIVSFLNELGYEVNDIGPKNQNSVDYPDYGIRIAQAVTTNSDSRGIVFCGTGFGMSIVVNRFPGVRGTLCSDLYTAKLCREHNNSNILIMGGRVVGHGLAREIVKVWLSTPFEGGRHQKRLDKINQFDKSNKI
jgi:ribose 5-phosphate isomerase B